MRINSGCEYECYHATSPLQHAKGANSMLRGKLFIGLIDQYKSATVIDPPLVSQYSGQLALIRPVIGQKYHV